ncbi:MAG: DHH family phosphoesterase, partial [Candidatus Aenigmatarchaeota archaeon]
MAGESSGTVYVIGHKSPDTDSVASAIAYAHLKNALGEKNVVSAVAGEINSETKFILEAFGVKKPEVLKSASGKKLILVDHNEAGQAVDGFGEAELLEVVDHHKIGGIKTGNPIFFHNEPLGATGTIIASFYEQNGVEIPKEIAGLMMAAILSDTVLFKSLTCTEIDKKAVETLAKLCGRDPMSFGLE